MREWATNLQGASLSQILCWRRLKKNECFPKDHFHSNLIVSWSFSDYQSWNIKYRLEAGRCWKLKFTGGAHPVYLRDSPKCCPDVVATRRKGSQAETQPQHKRKGMFRIPQAFCLAYFQCINLAESPNSLLVVDVTKDMLPRKKRKNSCAKKKKEKRKKE